MSLFYGYERLNTSRKHLLCYDFAYSAVSSLNDVFPLELKSGYPVSYLFGGYIDVATKITLRTHSFDNDASVVVKGLSLKYAIDFIKKDGTTTEVELKEINLDRGKIGSTNIFILDEVFTISDLISDSSMVGAVGA